jgi:hypothetical protein
LESLKHAIIARAAVYRLGKVLAESSGLNSSEDAEAECRGMDIAAPDAVHIEWIVTVPTLKEKLPFTLASVLV